WLLQSPAPSGELAGPRQPLQHVIDGAEHPVALVALALGQGVEVFLGSEEAGHQVLVGQAVGELTYPRIHFRLRGRAAKERLVIRAYANSLALGTGREAA